MAHLLYIFKILNILKVRIFNPNLIEIKFKNDKIIYYVCLCIISRLNWPWWSKNILGPNPIIAISKLTRIFVIPISNLSLHQNLVSLSLLVCMYLYILSLHNILSSFHFQLICGIRCRGWKLEIIFISWVISQAHILKQI